jgi:rubrerythrin
MSLWLDGNPNPPPKIDTHYGEARFKNKSETAGTKYPCKGCGKPTYRFVGSTPVCSDCTKKFEVKW